MDAGERAARIGWRGSRGTPGGTRRDGRGGPCGTGAGRARRQGWGHGGAARSARVQGVPGSARHGRGEDARAAPPPTHPPPSTPPAPGRRPGLRLPPAWSPAASPFPPQSAARAGAGAGRGRTKGLALWPPPAKANGTFNWRCIRFRSLPPPPPRGRPLFLARCSPSLLQGVSAPWAHGLTVTCRHPPSSEGARWPYCGNPGTHLSLPEIRPPRAWPRLRPPEVSSLITPGAHRPLLAVEVPRLQGLRPPFSAACPASSLAPVQNFWNPYGKGRKEGPSP